MTTDMDVEVVNVGIESKFSEVLSHFESSSGESDPFDLIRKFRDICSTKALQIKDELFDTENSELQQEFDSWQLETKLWHLVEVLYSYRLSDITKHHEYNFSSLAVKDENFRISNNKIAELSIIIDWVQRNSVSTDTSDINISSKWINTKHALETNDLKALTNKNVNTDTSAYIKNLDPDAQIRTNGKIHPDDANTDDAVFKSIYNLLIRRDFDEAVSVANSTGNFALSQILIGEMLPYFDAAIDKEYLQEREIPLKNQGCKHRLLWYQAVYTLAQQTNLNKYEKLIYNYLSGSNLQENLNELTSWDESLLLYCNHALVYETITFYKAQVKGQPEEDLDITIPRPAVSTIDSILNALLRSEDKVSDLSRHPLRIIMGGVMIKKILPLIIDTVKSFGTNKVINNNSLLRILVHLSIFINLVEVEYLDPTDFTKLVEIYLGKLIDAKSYNLVPIYLSYLPNEQDSVEIYSDFLSNPAYISSTDDRKAQISICKGISYFSLPINPLVNEEKLIAYLRRTVEKIIDRTEFHYKPSALTITINDSIVDNYDKELCGCIDWYLENSMFEDAIIVSLVIIKRFLINGKLAALKEFGREKDFKKIINSYNGDFSRLTSDHGSPTPAISEDEKEELLNYNLFIKGLNSIGEWKKFIEDNAGNIASFKTKDVENSIRKITNELTNLIMKWFANTESDILKGFRSTYISYLIIELLKIYEFSRLNSPEFLSKSFDLIKAVANEDENDLLNCFLKSGKLNEFLNRCGELALVASENGIKGVFL